MTATQIKNRITRLFRRYLRSPDPRAYNIVPRSLASGKLYEAYVLARIAEKLVKNEKLQLQLVNSNYLTLKSSPGPINRRFPRVELFRSRQLIAELWTDVEFLTLSYRRQGFPGLPSKGDYHELDILIAETGVNGRPSHNQVWLGAECKNTGYNKGLLKEILGIRRELSLLQRPKPTFFRSWPQTTVPADPPSCLLVYSTDQKVLDYSSPGDTFGIQFFHEPIT